jgi:hypothetical protein
MYSLHGCFLLAPRPARTLFLGNPVACPQCCEASFGFSEPGCVSTARLIRWISRQGRQPGVLDRAADCKVVQALVA